MDDSTGSNGNRWGGDSRTEGESEADGEPGVEPADEEVFRRGHAPGDEPRVANPDGERGDGEGGNVAGPSPGSVRTPVEPGSPSAENVFFVLLGVALTLFVFARMAGL